MQRAIDILKSDKEHNLRSVGLTPRTNFKGTQEDHDLMHKQRAEECQMAIDILSKKR